MSFTSVARRIIGQSPEAPKEVPKTIATDYSVRNMIHGRTGETVLRAVVLYCEDRDQHRITIVACLDGTYAIYYSKIHDSSYAKYCYGSLTNMARACPIECLPTVNKCLDKMCESTSKLVTHNLNVEKILTQRKLS